MATFMEKSIDWQPTCNAIILQTTIRDPTTAPPFKGNLTKLVTKGSLLAKLKHWINSKVEGSHTQPLHKNYCELFLEKIGGTAPHELDISTPPHLNLDLQVCLPILVANRTIVEGIIETKGTSERESILLCATRLYRQLWIWRCTLHRDVTSAFGFAIMACPIQGQITCSLLELQVPGAKKEELGSKLPLRVQTVRAPLSDGNGMIQSVLGGFLTAIPDNGPWTASPVPFISAGAAMTMSQQLHEANKAAIEIIATTTGSLVVRCCSLLAVQNLLSTTDGDSYHNSNRDIHLSGRDDDYCESAWYVKCKTPACFGPFWDTAATAISRTRDRLLTALKTNKLSSPEEIIISQSWLAMHPFDVIIRPHCQITVVRDCGEPFRGQLCFAAFVTAFHELVKATLIFQKITQSVHGDIHKNNIMLRTSPTSSSRLVLIDWDEALPKKPCHRLAPTVEEALRYPANLVDFPEAYTKQQFLHLFDHLLEEYYDNKSVQRWATSEQKDPEQITVSKVNERFRGLLAFLASDL